MHTWLDHVLIERDDSSFCWREPSQRLNKEVKRVPGKTWAFKEIFPFEEKKEQVKRSFFKRDEDDGNLNVERRQDEGHQTRLTDTGFERTNTAKDTEESYKELIKF